MVEFQGEALEWIVIAEELVIKMGGSAPWKKQCLALTPLHSGPISLDINTAGIGYGGCIIKFNLTAR